MSRVALGRVLASFASPLSGISAAAFAALSAARRKRFFHPRGDVYEATATFFEGIPFLEEGSFPALVRFSRGIGLPVGVPDVLGLAVKVPTLDQDMLLATSGEGAVSRHLLVPAAGFFHRTYSSVLPYEWNGTLIVLGAKPDSSLRGRDDRSFADLGLHAAQGRLRFLLTWAGAGTDAVTPFGSLHVQGPHQKDVSFNPFNCHPSLRPAGGLNRLRLDTYRASQRARPDSETVA